MQISNEVGPHRDLKQGIDLSALSAWRVGSQSAPIGTPPQRQICVTDQYLAAVYGCGPASVLKHIHPCLAMDENRYFGTSSLGRAFAAPSVGSRDRPPERHRWRWP